MSIEIEDAASDCEDDATISDASSGHYGQAFYGPGDIEDAFKAGAKHASSQWQPIETAPRDGTEILGLHKGCVSLVAVWHISGWLYQGAYVDLTHWIEIPKKPPISLPDQNGADKKEQD